VELAEVGKIFRRRINERLMLNGVSIIDPDNTYIDCTVEIGADTEIWPNTFIQGRTVIGKKCRIMGGRLKDMVLGDGVDYENSVSFEAVIGDKTHVGPFAYIRPGSKIGNNVFVGDFVEIKNSVIGDGTKMHHLSYIGDSDVGRDVNFGCGTITVNYDGKKKFRSTVGDGAFIGCNSNLVSPVVLGEGAYIAAGSTITDDVPGHALAIARQRQTNKTDWKDKRD
jgi:bifunctional UDP-N-acetylglucosamine pyrophosphorylase/glucosamine-1-phosphate N-acetyltransferase